MKLKLNGIFILIIISLVSINIALFVKGIRLSNEIERYESGIASYKESSSDLEQFIYEFESHSMTASLAAELDYGKFNPPIYSKNPQYALRRE